MIIKQNGSGVIEGTQLAQSLTIINVAKSTVGLVCCPLTSLFKCISPLPATMIVGHQRLTNVKEIISVLEVDNLTPCPK